MTKSKRNEPKVISAQDSIPFQRIYPDGICRTNDGAYSKTIKFADINYLLGTNDVQSAIFSGWCEFLNYFDSSIKFQLSFVNRPAEESSFEKISLPPQGDEFDSIREEYAEMLRNQLARGSKGLVKTRYLTFSVKAENLKAAKPRLERIETDVLQNFDRLGVDAEPLNGYERIEILYRILHINEKNQYRFAWDWLVPSGLSVKDFIAPSSFEFGKSRYFGMGSTLGSVSFLQILAPELKDQLLTSFLSMESPQIVTMHIQSVDQVAAIKMVKRKITDLDKSKIDEVRPDRALCSVA